MMLIVLLSNKIGLYKQGIFLFRNTYLLNNFYFCLQTRMMPGNDLISLKKTFIQ